MDPGWPSRSNSHTILCLLCKSSIRFVNQDPEYFFRHLMLDHQVYFNHNLLMEVSLRGETASSSEHDRHQNSSSSTTSSTPSEREASSAETSSIVSADQIQRNEQFNDLEYFDLSFLTENINSKSEGINDESRFIKPVITPESANDPAPVIVTAASENNDDTRPVDSVSDPLSVKSNSGNSNRHLVPDDLKALIIEGNPERNIKFTLSQRMNTQMVVDDYVLKKKKGPNMSRGGRVINWKCVNDSCSFTAVTWESQLQDVQRKHNHPAQPELYIKKQARVKIRENIVSEMSNLYHEDRPVSNLVNDVVNETNADIRDMIGSVDALKQAARRFNRKLQNTNNDQKLATNNVSNTRSAVQPSVEQLMSSQPQTSPGCEIKITLNNF